MNRHQRRKHLNPLVPSPEISKERLPDEQSLAKVKTKVKSYTAKKRQRE